MDKVAIAQTLVSELEARLAEMETIGALIAAAHLDAAIDSLCRECNVTRNPPVSD